LSLLNPWLGIIIVLALLGGLIGALAVFQKTKQPHPELVRKLLHIGMGLVTLSFPWLFSEAWPVIVLAALAVIGLLGVKFMKTDSISNVVHGVARESLGEIYFPISIAIIFALSDGNVILYIIPVLILTLADAVAALIGVRYGTIKYTTTDGVKSTEGSIAFFTMALLATLIPLLLFTQVGRTETLLIALIIASLVMYIEALAWKGLDNLFIPLGGFLLLKVYMSMGVPELSIRLAVILALFVIFLLYRKRTTLNDSATMAAALVGYLIWAAGDWTWFIPALLVFISYHVLSPKTAHNSERIHDAQAVIALTLPGMFWLFIAQDQNISELYFPFTVSFATQLGMIGLARLCHQYPDMNRITLWVRCTAQASVIIFVPWLLITGINFNSIAYASIGVSLVGIAVIGFYYLQPCIKDCPVNNARFWRQGGVGFVVSLAAAGFILLV